MKAEEATITETEFRKDSNLQYSKIGVEDVTERHEYELMLQRQYKHMIKRMRKDLIAEQIKNQELHEIYKSKLTIAEEECEKNRAVKQYRQQAQTRLEEFMAVIDADHFERTKRIGSLQKSIKNKELALERRI